jgi:hypothetical protein
MGAAKLKKAAAFQHDMIVRWEARICIDFALALSQMTGWLLHIDWLDLGISGQNQVRSTGRLRPLRIYVGDDKNQVFDVRGIKTFDNFRLRTIYPLAATACGKSGGMPVGNIVTKAYGEDELACLPTLPAIDAFLIQQAKATMRDNGRFMSQIPVRPEPRIPPEVAFRYSAGECQIFAEALGEARGVEPVALVARSFRNGVTAPTDEHGYVHSMLVYADGTCEDAWGRQRIEDVSQRYGLREWALDRDYHRRVIEEMRVRMPERFESAISEARTIVSTTLGRPDQGTRTGATSTS